MSDAAAAQAAAIAAQIAEANYFIYVAQVHFCTMYGITVWDWIVSIRQEYRLIWKSRWTAIKGLYFFARYYVLFLVPWLLYCFCVKHSQEFCNNAYKSPVAVALFNMAAAEGVLVVRTYAFFGRDIRVLLLLGSLLTGVLVYQLWATLTQMLPLPFFDGDTGPCFPMTKPHEAHILGLFIAPLLFDTLMTCLTLGRAFYMRKKHGAASQIIQIFLREGIFYYLLISAANLVNGIFYLQKKTSMSAIMIPFSVMLAPVLACRLILDIRGRAEIATGHASSMGGRRGPTIANFVPSTNGPMHADMGGNANIVSVGRHDAAIELQSVGDYKDDIAPYRSVQVPMAPMHGIRVDVEKGTTIR